jgi:hypothetical protein
MKGNLSRLRPISRLGERHEVVSVNVCKSHGTLASDVSLFG